MVAAFTAAARDMHMTVNHAWHDKSPLQIDFLTIKTGRCLQIFADAGNFFASQQ